MSDKAQTSENYPRVAMFGGTFDPVHMGHLRSAVELGEALELDQVRMIPVHVPAHRQAPGVSSQQRLLMLQAGIGHTPGLIADSREIDREGPSYSADTLATLREEFGAQARLIMAIGYDAFLGLPKWHHKEELLDICHIVVLDRPDFDDPLSPEVIEFVGDRQVFSIDQLMSQPYGYVMRLKLTTRMAISATEVRSRLQHGQSVRYLLPPAVEQYIEENGLYRTAKTGVTAATE